MSGANRYLARVGQELVELRKRGYMGDGHGEGQAVAASDVTRPRTPP